MQDARNCRYSKVPSNVSNIIETKTMIKDEKTNQKEKQRSIWIEARGISNIIIKDLISIWHKGKFPSTNSTRWSEK